VLSLKSWRLFRPQLVRPLRLRQARPHYFSKKLFLFSKSFFIFQFYFFYFYFRNGPPSSITNAEHKTFFYFILFLILVLFFIHRTMDDQHIVGYWSGFHFSCQSNFAGSVISFSSAVLSHTRPTSKLELP